MPSRILPTSGPSRVLATTQLVNSVGDGAFLVTSVLFFTRVGLSVTQIGFGLALGWGLGLLAGVPLGHLADRRGPRGVAIALAFAAACVLTGFVFVRSAVAFLVVMCGYACCQSGLSAARQAVLAGLISPGNRTGVRAVLQSAANAGLAVGAMAGGVALWIDTTIAYTVVLVVAAVCLPTAAMTMWRLPEVPVGNAPSRGPALSVLRDRPYALVACLNAIMLLYMPLLSLVIPLWIVRATHAPPWTVSVLLVVNTISVVLFQVPIAARVTGPASATRLVRFAGVALLVACAVFTLSGVWPQAWAAVPIPVCGAGLVALGEMALAAGAWEIGFGLAPDDKRGRYQGFFGAGVSVARMLGPVLLTTVILDRGTPGRLLPGAVFAAAGTTMGPAVGWARRAERAAVHRDDGLVVSAGPLHGEETGDRH